MVEERRHGRRSGRTVIVVVVGGGWRVSLWWCKHPCGLKVFPKSDVPKKCGSQKVMFPKSVVPKFPKVKRRLKHRRIAHTQQWPRENRGTTGATQKIKIEKQSQKPPNPHTCDTIHMRHHTHATPYTCDTNLLPSSSLSISEESSSWSSWEWWSTSSVSSK
jgi:hypothetical protein